MRLTAAFAGLLIGCSGGGGADGSPGADDGAAQGGAGQGEGEGEDAGLREVAAGAPTEPPPLPATPFEPRITDWHCPEGWSRSPTFREGEAPEHAPERLKAHQHCRPPAPPAQACPPGQIRRLGETVCVAHGVTCPAIGVDWAPEAELRARAAGFEGDVLYTEARGRDGVGTRVDPYPSIEAALEHAQAGDIVALTPGRYVETIVITERIALLGACVEQTAVVAPRPVNLDGSVGPTVEILGAAGSLVADLTVTGPAGGMSVRPTAGDLTLRALRFDGTATLALNVAEGPGVVTGEELSFVDTTAPDRDWGRGVLAHREGKIRLLRPSFHGNVYAAMGADQPSTLLEVEDAVVTATSAREIDDEGGFAMVATAGARMQLRRGWLDDNQSADIAGSGAGAIPGEPTEIDVADVISRNTREGLLPLVGSAFQVADGTRLVGRRVLIEGTGGALAIASHKDTTMQFEDVVVRGRDGAAAGVSLSIGAQAQVRRMVVSDVPGCWAEVVGAFLDDAPRDQGPPVALFEDLLVTGERSIFGAHAVHVADLTVRRALLAGNGHHLAAFRAQNDGTSVTLEDVRIVDVSARDWAELDPEDRIGPRVEDVAIAGIGVWITHGAQLTAKRLAIEDVTTYGLVVAAGGASAQVQDLLIDSVAPHSGTPERGGRGIHLQSTVEVHLRRAHIRKIGGFGIAAVGLDPGHHIIGGAPDVTLSELTIDDIAPIKEDERSGGIALVSAGPGSTALSDFLIRNSSLAGIMLATGHDMTAADGVLQDNLIGLNIQDEGFRWEGALRRVAFRNNTVDIDAVTAPIPSAREALDNIEF